MILFSFGIVLTISSVSSYNKKGMVFSFSHKNNSNWDASLKNDRILKNRDSLIPISSPLQQPPQFLPQWFCFVPSVETWRWKVCDLIGWFYNYRLHVTVRYYNWELHLVAFFPNYRFLYHGDKAKIVIQLTLFGDFLLLAKERKIRNRKNGANNRNMLAFPLFAFRKNCKVSQW